MRRRKYRDERNSRRNRRWLQDQIDAFGPLPGSLPIRRACSDSDLQPIRVPRFSAKAFVAAAMKHPERLIPFQEIADRPSQPSP